MLLTELMSSECKNNKLWVDDERNPPDDTFDVARTYKAAIKRLATHHSDEIYLDHDLGDFEDGIERTGYDVLMWIVQQKMDGWKAPEKYVLLTANPVGRKCR